MQYVPAHFPFHAQELAEAFGTFAGRVDRGIGHVVVVAQDGHDAVLRPQPREGFHKRCGLLGRGVYQVAREDDEVRLLPVHAVHHLRHKVRVARVGTQVEVRDLYNLVALEALGQSADFQFGGAYLQAAPAPQRAVELCSGHEEGQGHGAACGPGLRTEVERRCAEAQQVGQHKGQLGHGDAE